MTAIGMGLVFIAIIALWGLMDVMVKATNDRPKRVVAEQTEIMEVADHPENDMQMVMTPKDNLRKAAVAAVAIALHLRRRVENIPVGNGDTLSSWQLTRRVSILNQTANLINRKSRG